MLEFDETLTKKYTGKEALTRRVQTRCKHTTEDIPYYDRGLDISEFTYGNQVAAIKLAFKDIGPFVTYDGKNSRLQVYDISVDVSELEAKN